MVPKTTKQQGVGGGQEPQRGCLEMKGPEMHQSNQEFHFQVFAMYNSKRWVSTTNKVLRATLFRVVGWMSVWLVPCCMLLCIAIPHLASINRRNSEGLMSEEPTALII